MKKFFTLTILLLAALVIGCTDDDTPIPTPTETLELEFTLETNQDQMGNFKSSAIVEYDSKLYSVGGINSYSAPNLNNDTWDSSNGVAWVSLSNNDFAPRRGHTLTDFNANIWMLGGRDSSGLVMEDIWYSPDGLAWTNLFLTAPFGTGLGDHATFIFGTKLYVYARHEGIWSTPNGFDWTLENALPFPNRAEAKIVVLNNVAYCIGGYVLGTGLTNQVWRSTDGSNWELVPIAGDIFSPRVSHTATVYNNKIWVIGGEDGDPVGDIWYSNNGSEWQQYEGTIPFSFILDHTVLNYRGELWLFGGATETGTSGKIYSIREL